jgi:hypothetical protein
LQTILFSASRLSESGQGRLAGADQPAAGGKPVVVRGDAYVCALAMHQVENAPRKLSWHDNFRSPFTKEAHEEDSNPEAVLKNLAAQTGLTFREETRRVRVLRVERVK